MNRKSSQFSNSDNFGQKNDSKDSSKFRNQNGNRKPPSNYQQPQQQQKQNQPNHQDSSIKVQPQRCTLCSKSSVCMCSRCGDYYCSPTCQQEDWRSHRYICLSMPPLIPANFRPMKSSDIPHLISEHSIENKKEIPSIDGQNKTNNGPTTADIIAQLQQKQIPFMGPIPNAEYPKNKSQVMLAGFRSPNRVFIRSLESAKHSAFLKVCKAITECGKTAPKLQSLPKPGQFVLSLNPTDGLYHRAEVIAARSSDSIRILYMDYGTFANKKLSDLKQIPEEVQQLPRFIVQVALKDVPNYNMDENMYRILASYENFECEIEYTKEENNMKECILRSWNKNESINLKLIDIDPSKSSIYDATTKKDFSKGSSKSPYNKQKPDNDERNNSIDENKKLTNMNKIEEKNTKDRSDRNYKPEKPTSAKTNDAISHQNKTETDLVKLDGPSRQIQKPVLMPPFEKVLFEKNHSKFEVIPLDDSNLIYGYFGCIALSDLKNFQLVQQYMQNYEDPKQPYRPQVDEYCLAMFEEEWFRAKVLDASHELDRYNVSYIDYTNESVVKSADIRRYPMDFKLPCTTNLCVIDGLPKELNPKMLKYMKTRFLSLSCVHKVTKVLKWVDNAAVVQMDDLIEELKGESLL